MIDIFLQLLSALSDLDSEAQKDGPPTWARRNKTSIRVVLVICSIPFWAVLFALLIYWTSTLSSVARGIVIGIVFVQVIGFFALLSRRNKSAPPITLDKPDPEKQR